MTARAAVRHHVGIWAYLPAVKDFPSSLFHMCDGLTVNRVNNLPQIKSTFLTEIRLLDGPKDLVWNDGHDAVTESLETAHAVVSCYFGFPEKCEGFCCKCNLM